jgi:hypothetical protein
MVPHIGTASVAGISQAVSLAGGQLKGYRFTVPAGTATLEMRLNNRVGNPRMAVVGGLRLPATSSSYGSEGGQYTGDPWRTEDDDLITIANPTPGEYSVMVSTGYDGDSPASADLLIQSVPPTTVTFNGGTSAVTGQQTLSWKFFRIDVPAGVLGWDLRVRNVTSGTPQMVVARDLLPSIVGTNPYWWGPSTSAEWTSGYSWAQGVDWTGRYYQPDETNMSFRRFVAGSGRPLEPGTYYVGVFNSDSSNEASYILDSRGIGSGQFYSVATLNFAAGSNASITNLAPREAAYFKVTVPASTPSWEITLDPSLGEMLLMARLGTIPDPEADDSTQDGSGRQVRVQKSGPERYVILPPDNTDFLIAGDYYLAVVGEGQNPSDNSFTGSGNSSGTLTSRGSLMVPHIGTASVAGISQAVSLAGGQLKGYRFTVPAGTATLEMRLNNRVGNPRMAVVGSLRLPATSSSYGSEGGQYTGDPWRTEDDDLITIANPTPGEYSVMVSTGYDGDSPTSADLLIRQKPPLPLNFAASQNGNGNSNADSKQIINGERVVYAVNIPTTLSGQPVLGWKLDVSTTQGSAILRIYQNAGDTSPASMISTSDRTAIIVPPWLTPGSTWYAEVEGQGFTEYTLTSSPVELHRNAWTMPVSFNQVFGDSGLQNNGSPLPGDQGTDLGQGDWHFYAIDVPPGNGGLLRTELQAISGNPDLYIREDGVPTTHHTTLGSSYGEALIDRSLTGTATEYGNWVPLDGRVENRLRPGRWYLGVKAGGTSNVRYRLRATTGSVTDLSLNQIAVPGQTMAGGDWRYYRFTVPADAPSQWLLTFSQQLGDVVMWIRDTVPPGDGSESSAFSRTDWGTDYKNQGPYPSYDPAGTHTLTAPQLRPGSTYYAGFRANGDASFTISSSTGGGTLGTFPALDFYTGTYSGTIPADGSTVVTVSAPFEATRWRHSSTHASGVQIRIEQGSLVPVTGNTHYSSAGETDSSLDIPLELWPWIPGATYFIRFVNTTASPLPIQFAMNGTNSNTGDEDDDGLPDAWEILHFENTGSYGSDDDADFDGLANIIEYAFGLDPADGASVALPQAQRVGPNLVITFTEPAGISGITYGAQSNTTLQPSGWLPVPDTGSGTTHVFSVPIGTNNKQFMRLTITR